MTSGARGTTSMAFLPFQASERAATSMAYQPHAVLCRYRTTMCSSGEGCTRNICFFAHNEQELRSPPSSDSAQPWSLVASALPQPGQPQVLPDAGLELQGISNTGAVMASLAASSGMMVSPLAARCGSAGDALGAVGPVALSPGSSHSCPLPNSCLVAPGGAWHPTPAPGAPAVTTAPSAQQAQLQALLQHPQMQPMLQQLGYVGPTNGAVLAGGLNGTGYASTTHGVQGAVLGPTASQPPILSACGSAGVLCSMGQPQSMHLLSEGKQYSPAGSCYNISATAGMYASGGLMPGGGGLVAAAVTAPLDASVCNMQGLQPNSCDSLAASDCNWQHQQLAMLLQRMQLSAGATAGGALHFSSDSLSSSLLLGGSNPLPPMSHSLLSDLSNESLAALLAGHPLTQELAVNSAAHLSGMTAQDLQLLPLEASGLIQLSALDETAVVADQRKQAVTWPCNRQVDVGEQHMHACLPCWMLLCQVTSECLNMKEVESNAGMLTQPGIALCGCCDWQCDTGLHAVSVPPPFTGSS